MPTIPTIAPERLPALLWPAMPKAELHIHIEGSLGPDDLLPWPGAMAWTCPMPTSRRCAAPTPLPTCRVFWTDIYYAGAGVFLKEQDFYDMASATLRGQLWIT